MKFLNKHISLQLRLEHYNLKYNFYTIMFPLLIFFFFVCTEAW